MKLVKSTIEGLRSMFVINNTQHNKNEWMKNIFTKNARKTYLNVYKIITWSTSSGYNASYVFMP